MSARVICLDESSFSEHAFKVLEHLLVALVGFGFVRRMDPHVRHEGLDRFCDGCGGRILLRSWDFFASGDQLPYQFVALAALPTSPR